MSIELNLNELLYGSNGTDEIELPSGGKATVKEMTGHEQRSFVNRAKLTNGTAVQELIANCCDTFKGQPLPEDPQERTKFIQNMLAGDRQALVFAIRRFSLGSNFQFNTECPECRAKSDWEVDLSNKEEFGCHPYPHGEERKVEYTSKIVENLRIRFTLLDGNAEMVIMRKRNDIDLLTDLELRVPEAWDGEKWVRIQLNKMRDALISEMRRTVKGLEGYVDTKTKVTCPACSQEVEFDLLQVPDFMIPSLTS